MLLAFIFRIFQSFTLYKTVKSSFEFCTQQLSLECSIGAHISKPFNGFSVVAKCEDVVTLYFPMFPFDPPENIRKPKGTLGSKGLSQCT